MRDSVSNKWINFLYEYKEGVSHFDLKVKTDLSIVHGEESQGWFKPKRPFVEVKDANDYSEVKVLRSYRTKRRELDNWGIGPNVSFSVDKSFRPTVTVGIGIQRNFIHFLIWEHYSTLHFYPSSFRRYFFTSDLLKDKETY